MSMQYKKIVVIFAGLFLVPLVAFAKTYYGPTKISNSSEEEVTIIGPADLDQLKSNTLKVTGPLKFNKIVISNETEVTGPTAGEKGKFNNLKITGPVKGTQIEAQTMNITGPAYFNNIEVKGNAKITGTLFVNKGKFKNIDVVSDKVKLKDTTADSIHFDKNMHDSKKEQMLMIQGKSIINGDIVFDSGKGKVVVDKTVQIKGKVQGAEVVNH